MKKLFNKKFALILGSTIALLLVLTIAIVFLTKENTKSFTRSGYIIASSKENSTKYYFDEGTNYKTNINSELVFTDTSGEKVNVETDNFLHYTDGGIKFLKNGVIMDLESVNSTIVPYYNITNKSLLEYSKKSYYIETIDKTLAFNNLIGRISENKYIVAGVDVKLQLAGNDNVITGDYFEITFIEDGIIKVENQEISYQATAENSYVLVKDNIKIDLGLKKIYYNEEEKMSLTQMTIDGNENIEIIPTEEENKDNSSTNEGNNNQGNNNGNIDNNPNNGNGQNEEPQPPENEDKNPEDNKDNPTDGEDGENNTGTGTNYKKSASVELVAAEVGLNSIRAKFNINDPDKVIKGGILKLYITNVDSDPAKRLEPRLIDTTKKEYSFEEFNLSSNTNYILSIIEEGENGFETQYFQKLFRTDNFGVSLDKKYVTSDSIAYEVFFEDDSLVKSVKVSITDANGNPIETEGTRFKTIDKDDKDKSVTFDNLESNTMYNIVLDNIKIDNVLYKKPNPISKSIKTLKQTPRIGKLYSEVNRDEEDKEKNNFIIGVENVIDDDESITGYTYYIYKSDDINMDNIDTIKEVKRIPTKEPKVEVKIDGNEIKEGTNYRFKAIVEYNDNEKDVEIDAGWSGNLILAGRPYVEIILDNEKTTHNTLDGIIVIEDASCTIPMKGRDCSVDYDNKFFMKYYQKNDEENYTIEEISFNIDKNDPNKLIYDDLLLYEILTSNTTYTFDIFGDIDFHDGEPIRKEHFIGTDDATTKETENVKIDWKKNEPDGNNLINVNAKIVSTGSSNSAKSIKTITVNLYDGNAKDALDSNNGQPVTLIAKKIDIDASGFITLNGATINNTETFDIADIASLKELSKNGLLSKYYTIEIINAKDEVGNPIDFEPTTNTFLYITPPLIRMEENTKVPILYVNEIENQETENPNKNLGNTTIVGYEVGISSTNNILTPLADYFGVENVNEIVYYVCDADKNSNCTRENAVTENVIKLTGDDMPSTMFNLSNGTPFGQDDSKKFVRGHKYVFKAEFNLTDANGNNVIYPSSIDRIQTETKEPYDAPKYAGTYTMNIHKTTENTITYKYKFNDPDNALIDKKFYYTIDNITKDFDFSKGEDFVIGKDDEITLNNESIYKISVYRQLYKSNDENDKEEKVIGTYMFDGKYVDKVITDNVKFDVVTEKNSNETEILILDATNLLLDRVSAYHITLAAEGISENKKFDVIYPSNKLSTCTKTEGEEAKDYKCIKIDYANILEYKNKDITVSLEVYYDSGVINNNFDEKDSEGKSVFYKGEYILQENNYFNEKGKYIYDISSLLTNKQASGIFGYTANDTINKTRISMFNKIKDGKLTGSSPLSAIELLPKYAEDKIIVQKNNSTASINNKILDSTVLNSTNNKFKFTNVIPKINAVISSKLNGFDLSIIPTGLNKQMLEESYLKESDGNFYYYIEGYLGEDLFKEEKIQIALDNENNAVTTGAEPIRGYKPNEEYTFKIYACLKGENNSCEKNYLFDSTKTSYIIFSKKISTLKPEDLLKDGSGNPIKQSYLTHSSEDANYTSDPEHNSVNRKISMNFTAKTKTGNYDIKMILKDLEGNEVYNTTIKDVPEGSQESKDYKYTTKTDVNAIEEKYGKKFVYGYGYYNVEIYAITEVYDINEGVYNKKENLVTTETISVNNSELFKPLKDPEIAIEKSDEQYDETNELRLKPIITDVDKVIIDGKYYVQLLDAGLNPIKNNDGTDKVISGNVNEIQNVSFTDLDSDTLYYVQIVVELYKNNSDNLNNPKSQISSKILVSTSTDQGVALGSVGREANSNGVILTFSSGVNVAKIKKITYSFTNDNGIIEGSGPELKDAEIIHLGDNNYKLEIKTTKTLKRPFKLSVTYYIEKEDGSGYDELKSGGKANQTYSFD